MTDIYDSKLSSSFTYHYDKYSCVREFFYAHVVFNYLIMLSGLACFITRMLPGKYKWMHRWFGRMYIIFMIWSTATSLLIHNTGLPLAVLWSFCWVLTGMCLGWIVIVLHMAKMDRLATAKVEENIAKTGNVKNLQAQIAAAKGEIAQSKDFKQRFFSFKAVHGALMFTSWMNIIGRIFSSNVSGDFTCYTYPVYKSIDTPHGAYANTSMTLVSVHDPLYSRLPWGAMGVNAWAAALSLGPLIGGLFIGAIWSLIAARGGCFSSETNAKIIDVYNTTRVKMGLKSKLGSRHSDNSGEIRDSDEKDRQTTAQI